MKVGDIFRVAAHSGGFRVWQVVGVFLGGTHQEDVVELKTLDRKDNTQGRMLVPRDLLMHAVSSTSVERIE